MTKCKEIDCGKYAVFGFPDGKREFCKNHTIDNIRHFGCFGISKSTGLLTKRENEFNLRFNKLVEAINEKLDTVPTKEISIVNLFYSE